MIRTYFLLACIAVSAVSACTRTPTFVADPNQPSFDGGWTAGSGNRSGDTTTVSSSGAGAAATCAEEGGWTAGSGNEARSTCSAPGE